MNTSGPLAPRPEVFMILLPRDPKYSCFHEHEKNRIYCLYDFRIFILSKLSKLMKSFIILGKQFLYLICNRMNSFVGV